MPDSAFDYRTGDLSVPTLGELSQRSHELAVDIMEIGVENVPEDRDEIAAPYIAEMRRVDEALASRVEAMDTTQIIDRIRPLGVELDRAGVVSLRDLTEGGSPVPGKHGQFRSTQLEVNLLDKALADRAREAGAEPPFAPGRSLGHVLARDREAATWRGRDGGPPEPDSPPGKLAARINAEAAGRLDRDSVSLQEVLNDLEDQPGGPAGVQKLEAAAIRTALRTREDRLSLREVAVERNFCNASAQEISRSGSGLRTDGLTCIAARCDAVVGQRLEVMSDADLADRFDSCRSELHGLAGRPVTPETRKEAAAVRSELSVVRNEIQFRRDPEQHRRDAERGPVPGREQPLVEVSPAAPPDRSAGTAGAGPAARERGPSPER